MCNDLYLVLPPVVSASMHMSLEKKCGCKGLRSCLLCEQLKPAQLSPTSETCVKLFQCRKCGKLFQRSLASNFICTSDCVAASSNTEFNGVTVIEQFVDEKEERNLIQEIDKSGWAESQSGRRKQASGMDGEK